VPVWGVPSLDVIAADAGARLALGPDDEVLVVTDARRREVFWAHYRMPDGGDWRDIELLAGPGVLALAVLDDSPSPWPSLASESRFSGQSAPGARGRLHVVGEGVNLYPGTFGHPMPPGAPLMPDAVVLAQLAIGRAGAGRDQPTEPLYLRRPDVHEPPTTRGIVVGVGGVS
jgi:tRNA threonylcarbamoyladenosine biosynthesis protein TsaB